MILTRFAGSPASPTTSGREATFSSPKFQNPRSASCCGASWWQASSSPRVVLEADSSRFRGECPVSATWCFETPLGGDLGCCEGSPFGPKCRHAIDFAGTRGKNGEEMDPRVTLAECVMLQH